MSKISKHIILILSSILAILIWTEIPRLSYYSLQLSAVLLFLLIISKRFLSPPTFRLAESIISLASTLLIVSSSGGLISPFFFLNFILLFELSLFLEPYIPLFTSIGLVFYYLFTQESFSSWTFLFPLLAFPLMTPLAMYLGFLLTKYHNQKTEIAGLKKHIESLEEKNGQKTIDQI